MNLVLIKEDYECIHDRQGISLTPIRMRENTYFSEMSSSSSELSGRFLSGEQVESLLAFHSLLRERIIRREPSRMCTDGRIIVGIIELNTRLSEEIMCLR